MMNEKIRTLLYSNNKENIILGLILYKDQEIDPQELIQLKKYYHFYNPDDWDIWVESMNTFVKVYGIVDGSKDWLGDGYLEDHPKRPFSWYNYKEDKFYFIYEPR